MTLGQFFEACSTNSTSVLIYFIAMPAIAMLLWLIGKGEAQLSPFNYIYSFILYGVCIPGLFSVFLSIYKFLFERDSIMDANVYTQILPIISMFVTLTLVRKNANLDDIPGFGKLSSLMLVISIVLITMWIVEKTNIYVFTYMPFYQFLIMLVAIFVLIRYLFKRAL